MWGKLMEFQLDARPFFQILHNLIRQDELDYDRENTAKTVEWVRENAGMLRKVTSPGEFGCVMAFYAHWDKHKIAPDRKMMTELIHSRPQPKTLLDVMDEYDKHVDDLEQVPYLNLGMYLDQRKLDYEKFKLTRTLQIASDIALGSVPMNDKAKTVFTGPRDAMKYLHQRFHEGVLIDDVRAQGGDVATVGVGEVVRQVARAAEGYRNAIPTYTPIDDAMTLGPTETIKYVGIAGFSNQRKSTWLFTLAYQAAERGYRVLFIPRECTIAEADRRFIWLHAARIGRSHELPALVDALNPRYADPKHIDVIREVADDMQRSGVRIETRDCRDWASIRSAVQSHIDDPYAVLAVDYIAHLDTPGERNQKEGIVNVYRLAQELSISYEGGRGLVVMTPVQVGKTSEKVVASPEHLLDRGVYRLGDLGVIDYHTDEGRGMDALLGIWSGEGIRQAGLARVSCIKSRQMTFEPFYLEVDHASQLMTHVSNEEAARILGQHYAKGSNRRSRAEDKPGPLSQEISDMKAFV